MKEKKGIIFDMDGTVWDSSENVARSWTVKVQEAGFDKIVTQDDIKSVMGKPMDVIADMLFTYTKKGKQRNALRDSCEKYEIEYLREHGGTLYPDVIKTWEKLKKDGYHLYIVSNCQAGYVEAFLEFFKIPWGDPSCLIEDIECYGNNFLQKDENIKLLAERNKLTKACYVGDIQSDYDATIKAGFPFIHAAYGFGTINVPVPKISKFSDLREVIKEVI